jgi:serine/threonine protein kinase
MAPEMILGHPYRTSVDFWQFGCLLYELHRGRPPFMGKNKKAVHTAILAKAYAPLEGTSAAHAELAASLLNHDPEERVNDWLTVISHPFFSNMDWQGLEDGLVESPIQRIERNSEHTVFRRKGHSRGKRTMDHLSPPQRASEDDTSTCGSIASCGSSDTGSMEWSGEALSQAISNFDVKYTTANVTLGTESLDALLAEKSLENTLKGFTWMHPELDASLISL